MKKLFAFLFALASLCSANAQAKDPISWQAVYNSISATEGEIIITGTIEKGWHTYSQRATDGPVPTSFTFVPMKQYQLVGKMEEMGAKEEFDKAFDAKIFVFSGKAEFRQKIKITGKGFTIQIKLEYMCCNDAMCLPPKTTELQVKL